MLAGRSKCVLLLFNTLGQADLVHCSSATVRAVSFTAPASLNCRYPRHFAAAALGVMMSAASAGAAEIPPPPLCGKERKIQCYCGECSVVTTGDPLGGVEYTNLESQLHYIHYV
jgi:hypothetical protein